MRPPRYLARHGPGHGPPVVARTWRAALPRHEFGSLTLINNAASLATLVPLGRIDAAELSLALRVGLEAPMLPCQHLFQRPDHARRRVGVDRRGAGRMAAIAGGLSAGREPGAFLIGRFIETSASIIVLAPILAPVAMHFGIVPVPFGVNLFAACTVARIPLEQVVTRLIPFVLVIFGCLMLITCFPMISIGLRDLVYAR